jgi:hypothetical protein
MLLMNNRPQHFGRNISTVRVFLLAASPQWNVSTCQLFGYARQKWAAVRPPARAVNVRFWRKADIRVGGLRMCILSRNAGLVTLLAAAMGAVGSG